MGNVEHSNFNCWLRKGDQLLTSLYDFFFFFIKCRFFCPSILLCFEQSSLLLNCITLYILFVFFEHFCFVCLHFHMLHLCFVFLFFSFVFLLSKTPRKAVLFHEYQASTGRFNKFVSLLATSPSVIWSLCQGMCVCVCGVCVSVSLITGHPLLRKYASWYCQGLSKTWATLCVVCVCVLGRRPSIREAQQLQVHLKPNCTNVKRNCVFQ